MWKDLRLVSEGKNTLSWKFYSTEKRHLENKVSNRADLSEGSGDALTHAEDGGRRKGEKVTPIVCCPEAPCPAVCVAEGDPPQLMAGSASRSEVALRKFPFKESFLLC